MPVRFPKGPAKYRLRHDSPIRAWLESRQAAPTLAGGEALLGALANPAASGWAERAVAYQTLGEIDLSPEERAQACYLLTQAQRASPLRQRILSRIGHSVLLAFLFTVLTVGSVVSHSRAEEVHSESCMAEAFAWLDMPVTGLIELSIASPVCFAGLLLLDHRRNRVVQCAAATALQRIDATASEASADAPSPEDFWQQKPGDDAETVDFRLGVRNGTLESRLPRRSRIRAWLAAQRTGSDPVPAASLLQALTELSPLAHWERAIGCRALEAIPLSSPERAHASRLLCQTITLSSPNVRFSRFICHAVARGCIAGVSAACLLTLLLSIQFLRGGSLGESEILGLLFVFSVLASLFTLIVSGIFLLVQSVSDFGWTHEQKTALKTLARIGGPECIVALEAHLQSESVLLRQALQTIHTILPLISENWYGRLPAGGEQTLLHLAASPQEKLALEALDAVGRACSGNTLAGVEKLRQSTRFPSVAARADALLPILIARRAQESSVSTLLRPSQAQRVDQLLRPAHDTPPDRTNLLRPSDLPVPD